MLFHCFVGLALDDAVWVRLVCSSNRERLIGQDVVVKRFDRVVQKSLFPGSL